MLPSIIFGAEKDALEAIAERLRTDKVQNAHGDWQIELFYKVL